MDSFTLDHPAPTVLMKYWNTVPRRYPYAPE